MPESTNGGQLYVSVSRSVRSSGEVLTTLSAERIGRCYLERVGRRVFTGRCPILWSVEKEVGESSFSVDATLDSAWVDTTLRGDRLALQWNGDGDLRARPGVNDGYLLLLSRAAVTGGRWGNVKWQLPGDPKKRDVNEYGLYRRFEDP